MILFNNRTLLLFFYLLGFLPSPTLNGAWIEVDKLLDAPKEIYRLYPIKQISQGHIGYKKAPNQHRFFASHGASSCIILAARHRGSKMGFLAHISMFNEIDPRSWMGQQVLDRLKLLIADTHEPNPEQDVVDFYLFGGWNCCSCWPTNLSAEKFIDTVDTTIKSVGNIYYQASRTPLLGASLLVDMETGEFYSYDPGQHQIKMDTGLVSIFRESFYIFTSFILHGLYEE